ncbi:MAG: SDR family NAD(P)-dependent oxidoreductase, partial [Umezawaea sp.]
MIECLVTVSPNDFTLDQHRIRGVPTLPAAAFLDLAVRILGATGISRVVLRDVTFTAPLGVDDQQDREIRCTVSEQGHMRLESRAPGGEWVENVTAELVRAVEPEASTRVGDSVASGDLSTYYERARAAGVVHGAAMRCVGAIQRGPEGVLAELRLEQAVFEDRFSLHPAKLDAATVVAFGAATDDVVVPVYLKELSVLEPLRGICYVHVPSPAVVSGEVVTADFTVRGEDGRFLAGCRGFTWKRLADKAPAEGKSMSLRLRELVSTELGKDVAAVDSATGFYDLGLDSLALLKLVRKVEDLVGESLYPTLLFEYGTIDSLAAHLSATYAIGAGAVVAEQPEQPAEPATTSCWTSHWVAEAAPERQLGRLAVIGPDWLVSALRDAGATVDESAAEAVVHVPHDRDLAEACQTLFALASRYSRLTVLCPGRTPQAEALAAAARTVMAETPRSLCRVVFVPESADPDLVLTAVRDGSDESEVDRSTSGRLVRRWAPASEPGVSPLRENGCYVVTGGSGGLARLLTDHLVERYHARVMLVGRRPPAQDLLDRWRGADVRYLQADVTDARDTARAAQAAREAFGSINGVIHAAAVRHDGVHVTKRREGIASVMAPKILGAINLDAATADDPLDFFVVFSSSSAQVANPGQADYAAANAFLEAFAERRSGNGRSLAIGWPYWAEGGMRVSADVTSDRADGMVPMPTAQGIAAFERVLSGADSRVTILHGRSGVEQSLAMAPPTVQRPAASKSTVDKFGVREVKANDGIAIIGVAGRYPQAPDLAAFWEVLLDGVDCVTEVPSDRWNHDEFFDPAKGTPGRTYGRWGGFLEGADRFDPAFFGISRREAERMDPQERLFLSTCWHTLEDAGYPPEALRDDTVGVFAGVMWNHYQLVDGSPDGVAPSALHTAVPNRVSYTFDLTGPSFAVDTACSSSLTALHLAVTSLRRGECDLALAGGVNVIAHPQKYLQLAQGNWLSTDGRCRAFGKGGSGYVPGEGVGAVLLKPLAHARRDGDVVYGVIRGTSINHSGRTSGVTVPSPGSQARLIGSALRDAGWDPATIGYVEAHGTGTSLGDPIEIVGLTRVFETGGSPAVGSCAVGSVKSNIGHLESAAGIAGLTKVLLQMRHQRIVPSLHADELNPHIDFASTPFMVPTLPMSWTRTDDVPLRAGISAFGAGGANAHVLVEEGSPLPPTSSTGPWLCVLSARDPEALAESARRLACHVRATAVDSLPELVAWLADRLGISASRIEASAALGDFGLGHSDLAAFDRLSSVDGLGPHSTLGEVAARCAGVSTLADLSYTLQVGRARMATRLAVLARSAEQLATSLERYTSGSAPEPGEFWGLVTADEDADCAADFRAGRLAAVAAAWVAGADVPWSSCYSADRPHRISLPGYPLREERCWPGHWEPASRTEELPAVPQPVPEADVDLRLLPGGIAMVTMRAPTFTDPLIERLVATFDRIVANDDVNVVVLTGGEGIFSMGGSAEALAGIASGQAKFTDRPFLYEGLLRCDRPVVCAMRGHAAGGGLTFGLYADIVVMSQDGEYRANFLSSGFTPGLGATYILERRLGSALASEMLLTGRALRGRELERRGANVAVVPDDQVLPTALELARSIAAKPPSAVRALKTELARRVLADLPDVLDNEVAMHDTVLNTETERLIVERFPVAHPGEPVPVNGQVVLAVLDPRVPESRTEPPPAEFTARSGQDKDIRAVPTSDAVRVAVEDILGGVLYLRREEIDQRRTFAEMGLDSVGAVEIIGQLNRHFGTDLDSTTVYDQPTVPALVEAVAADIARSSAVRAEALAAREVVEQAPFDRGQVRLPDSLDDPDAATEGFAVIGMSGAFPDAPDLAAFWRNLAAGRCSIAEVPVDRWDVTGHYDPDRRAPGRTYSKWAAMLPDVARFDAPFFNLSPLDAEAMDPQQRLFLQHAWTALEDAGYAGDHTGTRPWGVFAGCAAGDYADLLTEAGENSTSQAFLGNTPSVLVARIAYMLNFSGPAVAIDTACSSSLVAVDMACGSLARGDCEVAIAGGVAVMCTPKMHVWTSSTGMLSPTGQCRPFDAAADGIVLGEGVGAVVLKKLDRAVADGDHIHGVILGSGVNSDGKTNGLTAPSATAQAALISRVRERAGVKAEDIGYVEAHGTGTELGDPIEVKGLVTAFGGAGAARLGSVKGNIGHTTTAAGIAGLLKVLLALEHDRIPPSPGYERTNPHIDLDSSPFRIATESTPWRPGRRIGTVSSFGFSGVNCHVVVAEGPRPAQRSGVGPAEELITLSAKDEKTLRRRAADLAAALDGQELGDVAYTLAVGRRHLPVRTFYAAKNIADLRGWLADLADGRAEPTAGNPMGDAYLNGDDPNWTEVYAGRPVRRVPLPTYPFARDRHWVRRPSLTELVLDPGDPLVRDHVIGGAPVLPATAGMVVLAEVARAEGLLGPLRIKAMRWPRPVVVTEPRTLQVRKSPKADGFAVTLADDSGEYVQGTVTATAVEEERLDLPALRGKCLETTPVDEIYRRFAAGGVDYRGDHRALEELRWGAADALGTLRDTGKGLVPSMLDAALQAAIVLVANREQGPLLPFAVERVEIVDAEAIPRFTHVHREKEHRFVVLIADATGRVCVRMGGMHLRPAPQPPKSEGMIFVPEWRPAPALSVVDKPVRVAVVAEPGDQLALELLRTGEPEQALLLTPDQTGTLVAEVPPDRVYVVQQSVNSLFSLVKAMNEAGWSRRRLTLTVVLRDEDPATAAAMGLVGAIRAEYPRWRVGCVAVETASAQRIAREDLTERLVVLRGDQRLVRRFTPAPPAAGDPVFRTGGSYLILGGAGGLGRTFSKHLARVYHARLTWIGRRAEDDGIRAARAEIESLGGQVVYCQAADTDALKAAVAQAGPVDGAIHAAMVLRDRPIATMSEADLADVLAPKVEGAIAFAEAVAEQGPLDFLVFFSSAVSFTDAIGQGNYAAASCFEDAYAQTLLAKGLPVSVINWGFWGSVGAVAAPGYRERFAALGISPLEPQDGVLALEHVLAARLPQALVVKGTPEGLAGLGVESFADAVEGYADLNAYSRSLLSARFRDVHGVPAPGQRITSDRLAQLFSVVPSRRRLFDAVLEVLERSGSVRLDGSQVEIIDTAVAGGTVRNPELAGHARLLEACVQALPDVLAGTRSGVEVLFPGGSMAMLDDVYRGNSGADFHHRLVADQVVSAAEQVTGRRAEILEIGAGTGASTAFVLKACEGLAHRPGLHFTDISPAFLNRARQRFGSDDVTFGLFDVERDPAEQGLQPAGYDIVIAANVLHATVDISATLVNVAALLRPGGRLVINETTMATDFLTLTFGLTEGWWRFTDPDKRLPSAPLLGVGQWRRVLAEAGFAVDAVDGVPGTAEDRLPQCVLVASKQTRQQDGQASPSAVRAYVREVFAEVLKFGNADLDERATFDAFGVDSLVSLSIIDRFERDLGELPATLLFQHTTIESLAAYLAQTRPAGVATVAGTPVAAPVVTVPVEPPVQRTTSDIAVIGVTGRYPGSPDLAAFWQNLAAGKHCVTEAPSSRFDVNAVYDPQPGKPQHSYGRWGGFIDGVDLFDPGFFGILPRDAAAMDPQERLFLQTAWTLLQNAGYLAENTKERSTGVFVGTMYGAYGQMAAANGWPAGKYTDGHSPYWSIANRVSYTLDLRGPSFAVDSACSSSLTAVHLAAQSLLRGECRMAIAGGVNLILHPAHLVALSSMHMLSADGACKVFDERADGFAPGEGVGAVLLKPLAAAEADGDDIWAVIKGSHVNAGGRTAGYTVPNPNAQADLVSEAIRRSGVAPATIGYVEAHGTGTSLGDPIELSALARALSTAGGSNQCAVGSVKANIGHLEGAAGIAGLTKVLLQLRAARIAPCVNLDQVNSKIDLRSTPFVLPDTLLDWKSSGPRRAGISSFGAGGANAHLVVEEYPRRVPDVPQAAEHVFLLSAQSVTQLRTMAANLAEVVADQPLDSLAFSSQVGRAEFAERLAVIAGDARELVHRLTVAASGGSDEGVEFGSAAHRLLDDSTIDANLYANRGLRTLARLWSTGEPVDWSLLWTVRPRRVELPPYPFDLKRYWLPDHRQAYRLSRPGWRRQDPVQGKTWSPRVVLVIGSPELAAAVGPSGVHVAEDADFTRVVTDLAARDRLPDAIVHVPTGSAESLLWAVKAVLSEQGPVGLRVVTGFLAENSTPAVRALPAMLRAIALENSKFSALSVSADSLHEVLLAELRALDPGGRPESRIQSVRYADGVRLVSELQDIPVSSSVPDVPVRAGGTYFITGGGGALGREFAAYLSRQAPVTVVLASRSPVDTSGLGARVVHYQADLSSAEDTRRLIGEVRRVHGPLNGVIHAAGITRDSLLVRKSPADVAQVLAAKIDTAVNVDQATAEDPLDFFVLFSSVVAFTGNLGQADYSYANAYLNEFASDRAAMVTGGTRRGRTVSIAWPLWSDGGMTVDAATRKLLARRWSSTPLATEDGFSAFARALSTGESTVVVSTVGPEGSDPAPLSKTDPASGNDLAVGHELAAVEPAAIPSPDAAPVDVLPAVPSDAELLAVIESDLRAIAAKFLLVDRVHIDLTADLMDTGFDSISLTELISEVNDRYDLDLLPTVLFESANLSAFAQALVEEHGPVITARWVPVVAAPTASPDDAEVAPVVDAGPRPVEGEQPVDRAAVPSSPVPVAIVGMAGVMPGSANLEEFWQHLVDGEDLIRGLPDDRTDLLADPRTKAVQGGFLDDVRGFDAQHFGISPREAALMDPRQRLFLQTVWRAIEDAGYAPSAFAGTTTGLFAGVSACDYDDLLKVHEVPIEAHTASGIAQCILANRVSHLLDLRGPSEAIDTACSSSLVAVHRAVRAIQTGECDAALAGGVNVLLSPGLFVAFTDSGMLSPDGRCKSFDAAADGYGRGEGVGVVLLKPLDRALTDGDHVYAVVKGSAVNHGGHATSLTAPNPKAQGRVIANAYRDADVDPKTVGYVEAHGTGTSLGDPIEVEGLKKGFAELGADSADEPWVGLGTVKANIGHLEAAAGIAGLLKVLLCLKHGQLPPTINLREPNQFLKFSGTPFFLVRQVRDWDVPEVRRAGVSSFGFGGTNAHVVLESHAESPGPQPAGPYGFVLSAPSQDALVRYASDLADFLAERPEAVARAAYTLQVGREPLRHRLAFLAENSEEAVRVLREGGASHRTAPEDQWSDVRDRLADWAAGQSVDWASQWPVGMRRLAGLPSFPFATTAHWFPERSNDSGRKVAVHEYDTGAARPKLRLTRVDATRFEQPEPERPDPPRSEPIRSVRGPVVNSGAVEAIRGQLSVILGVETDWLDSAGTFAEMGLDSIFRMELVRWLNTTFDTDLKAADLYEHDSITALAGLIGGPLKATNGELSTSTRGDVRELLERLVVDTVQRPIDPARSFSDNGFTSFDMLRLINELDQRFGPQRKTLLFDRPTVDEVAAELTDRYGGEAASKLDIGSSTNTTHPVPATESEGPTVVLKRELDAHPELADAISRLEREHGMEGGLAGRDIAPFALIGSARQGYFNVSVDNGVLFAWSYVGPGDRFRELAGELVDYSRGHGLKPNFLSLQRVEQIDGEPFTTTPFGALQRMDDIGDFSLAGGKMTRLRYLVRKFERLGACRTVEYRSGTDAKTDTAVAAMLDRWTDTKQMINPYVAVVREEIREGRLTDRHRLFLTYVDDVLANTIIITKIPSAAGYLLDLEFYPPDAPLGGLEYAMVRIIEVIAAEGCTTFSLGASFGVKLDTVPNADPGIERELEELRSMGVFGKGNFQFKNKFRPVNQPIYLCQPAGDDRTPVSEIILMIANPQLRSLEPVTPLSASPQGSVPRPTPVAGSAPSEIDLT